MHAFRKKNGNLVCTHFEKSGNLVCVHCEGFFGESRFNFLISNKNGVYIFQIRNWTINPTFRLEKSESISTQPAVICSKSIMQTPKKMCEICSKFAIKTLERRQWRRSVVVIVNFEPISHIVLVFPLLTLNR